MNLTNFYAIAGKPGLFKYVGPIKNGIIVESLLDGKRLPANASQKIVSLEDISIYTENEDLPLKDIFTRIFTKENGQKAIDHKSSDKDLLAYFSEIVPEYDRDRVYVSDIKKVITWFNQLQSLELLSLEEEVTETENAIAEEAENTK